MHEFSLVRALLSQVQELVADQPAGAVLEIHLECGPWSGIEPALVYSAFDQLRRDSPLGHAQLLVKSVPLAAACQDCGEVFEPPVFCFRCPACDSTATQVIRGEGVILDRIVMADTSEGSLA